MRRLPQVGVAAYLAPRQAGYPPFLRGWVRDVWHPGVSPRPDWVSGYANAPLVQVDTGEHGLWVTTLEGIELRLPFRTSRFDVESWLGQ